VSLGGLRGWSALEGIFQGLQGASFGVTGDTTFQGGRSVSLGV